MKSTVNLNQFNVLMDVSMVEFDHELQKKEETDFSAASCLTKLSHLCLFIKKKIKNKK